MTKTFVNTSPNALINENYYEVPNIATTSFNISTGSPNMSCNYPVNESVNSHNNRNLNGTSTTHLYDDEEPKSRFSRYIGVIFLLVLILISIGFLTFAIFYDEIVNPDHETSEEYWDRIQKEIKMRQNLTQMTLINNNPNLMAITTDSMTEPIEQIITFEDFIFGQLSYRTFNGKWISKHELLYYDTQNNLCITDINNLNTTVLINYKVVRKYRLSGLLLSKDRQYLLNTYKSRTLYRYSTLAKYRVYSIVDRKLSVPIVSPDFSNDLYLNYAEWGPIGSEIVFVHRNDIYFKADVNSVAIRLTHTGSPVIYNGVPDWVYEEEIISGPKVFWLSPGGTKLVYLTINDTNVDVMTWPVYGYNNQYTKVESIRYPKPGRPNPKCNLHYIDLHELHSTNISFVDQLTVNVMPPQDILNFGDHYFTAFQWIDNNLFSVNWMNRAQNYSMLTTYNTANNMKLLSNFKLQSNIGWIDLFSPPIVLPDKKSYAIRVPKLIDKKHDLFNQIASVSVMTGESTFLTSSLFEVTNILNVNKETNRIYFMAVDPLKTGEKHLMSVTIDQIGNSAEPTCHTCLMNTHMDDKNKSCLVNDINFSEGSQYYVLNCLGPNIPRSEIRRTSDDTLMLILEENKALAEKIKDVNMPKKILIKVPVGNYQIDVMLIVPHDFNEKSGKKYPLVFHVYGGPGSEDGSVNHNYFYNGFEAFLVANRSVIYAKLDSRGSPNHGCKFMYEIYRRLGSVEVEDTIAVAKYMRDKLAYIEPNSISLWGWSYGGYLTTMALEMDYNNTVFKCGVAVAPVSDWMYYDSVYVERYMGFLTPDDNHNNYVKSSTLDKVSHLNGKKYLIMFGTADDNVHTMNSMMLLKAMNEANIKYETQIYPDNRHSLQKSMFHMYKRLVEFFYRCHHQQYYNIVKSN
ncbi:venom dipeptidyl peptidase 4-like [Oppia nitens]|uniref:venom dipeptidyl peptidase 4-like n=1 Tax=Oppia nitens TaxID=1686743 RepID=UPI0023DC1D2C|nr:venom dipeptidyl peptidase 4-like [Oppia nitens]